MKKFATQLIQFTFLLLVLLGLFNWVVDPYWINHAPEIRNLNLNKPAIDGARPFKIFNATHQSAQVLILGTSREYSGIDPENPIFNGLSVFNAATTAQPILESKQLLSNLAMRKKYPEQVLFGLYFENANIYFGLPPDYSEENFNDLYPYKSLFSFTTLKLSIKTLQRNLFSSAVMPSKDGFRSPDMWVDQMKIGQHKMFRDNERNYIFHTHNPLPLCKSSLISDDKALGGVTPMQNLREAVATAYKMKSDMRLFIGPSHARQWETVYASGLWEQFEDWKRMVINIVEVEAVKANAKPFPVWDFSGYNSITEENVPLTNDINKRMKYFYESSHYTPASGDLVLKRIYNSKNQKPVVPDDFGVLLTNENIEEQLIRVRKQREVYLQTHPEDISEIYEVANEVAKIKHCKSQ